MANITETFGRDIRHKSDFVKKDNVGDLQTIEGLENYKEALLRRWITTPGSLVHRPDYGAGLMRFKGALSSIPNQRKIASAINEQAMRDPRTEKVLGVSVTANKVVPQTQPDNTCKKNNST